MAGRKMTELSSREEFIVEQFANMKKVNKMAEKLFDLYYVDIDSEMSPMMRSMVPKYYVDPANPEHPAAYSIVGKSSVSYLERVMTITPYVNEKRKMVMDLSAWKGLLINPVEFSSRTKEFRKTKLEPMVLMGEQYGERFSQSLIIREGDTPAKQELVLPFLHLPSRKIDGEDAYQAALSMLVYDQFYQYMRNYRYRPLDFTDVTDGIDAILQNGSHELYTEEGDVVIVTKSLLPTLATDQMLSIAKVEISELDSSYGRYHYIIQQSVMNEFGEPHICIYTLVAAIQM